jgi:hypothetical protein
MMHFASLWRTEKAVTSFNHAYCRWLEELAEAQKHCENVARRVLAREGAGKPVPEDLSGVYVEAHRLLRNVAERFPASGPSHGSAS